ncbi:type I secretion system permease/ATPase [Teredinibacter sp. KSP-S5-2]|uniref:type I secretion system permease/ATPase n=1 Tax=Teredinibacter sp. KSP-S5-2 TaxID=3034506 RepID=UPI002934B573|nr:type I secretion system permease/ATPase [Teredinibacter sp. KSP-S5-2]WNO10364.1 type I secretion system permease/ATPase [Teredinibacter sp. KSP-S5-2]
MTDETTGRVGAEQKNNVAADPLLLALIHIANSEQILFCESSLTAGLPLVNGMLTPELSIQAAKRAGLSAQVVKRQVTEISSLVLPVILLLEGNNVVVLKSLDVENNKATAYFPLLGREDDVSLTDLDSEYTGFAIFTCPDRTSPESVKKITGIDSDRKVHWFWGVLGHSWRIYRDVLLASVFINLFALANPLFVMNVYDRVVPNEAVETLWALALGVFFVYVFDFLLKTLRVYFIEVAGKKSDVLLSAFIFERVLGVRYENHPVSVGAFASRLREFETVRQFITSSTVTALVDLPFVILFLLVVFYIGGSLVWVPLIIMPTIVLIAFVGQRFLHTTVLKMFSAAAMKNATLVESVSSLDAVKALSAESKLQRRWESSVGQLSFWGLKSRMISANVTGAAGFLQQLGSVAVVVVGVYLIRDNQLTMGALIACVILTGRVLAPLAQIAGLLVQYQQSKLALSSLEEIVNQPQERDSDRVYTKRTHIRGDIEFRNVCFSYPGEAQESLKDISFKINAGEKVALIGRLGSGKSTIQKIIVGLYQPQKGEVHLDGIDAKQIDPSDLRSEISYVQQDTVLFSGSVRENIIFGKNGVTDQEIIRAAEISGVSDFVDQHPMGFERAVGERGEMLSGGQRQAISIARSLIGRASVYLLDEPTSAMDNTSEAKLIANLKETLKEKSLILVTHKTSLLQLVDRVIVVDGGRIVADGDKETVLDALKRGQLRVS